VLNKVQFSGPFSRKSNTMPLFGWGKKAKAIRPSSGFVLFAHCTCLLYCNIYNTQIVQKKEYNLLPSSSCPGMSLLLLIERPVSGPEQKYMSLYVGFFSATTTFIVVVAALCCCRRYQQAVKF
jgi:hypothetical protein